MIELANISIFSAFLAGVVSFLSPCVLPLVPGYVSYISGRSLEELQSPEGQSARMMAMGLSLCFITGFSLVFIMLGASASAIGGLLSTVRYEAGLIAGAVILLFGLHMMGLLKFGWLNRDIRLHSIAGPQGSAFGAFILGMAFAFGWTPCIGPILGSILTLSSSLLGVSDGVALLGIYSLGLAVPFLLVAGFTGHFMKLMQRFRLTSQILHKSSGGILALIGVAMMTGTLNMAGTWMLETFPGFQELLI